MSSDSEARELALRVDPVRMARIWYDELSRLETPEARARRAHIRALLDVINQRHETIQRLNLRCQRAESAVSAVAKAVGEWKVDETKTYVPLHTLRKIAAAVGVQLTNRSWELNYHRMRRLKERLACLEKNLPSPLLAVPEDYDAWLRDLIPDDQRLAFYRWVGNHAVEEALAEFRENMYNDPTPAEGTGYQDDVEELLEVIDPGKGADPFPTKLPLGRPFCDVDWHVHTHGGDRLPTCRLDSPE